MSTRGRTATADDAGDLAGAVREAGFVHLVAAADGDALAAAGLLARGCRAADVPFQASVARTDAERERRLASAASEAPGASNSERQSREHDDLTVIVGDRRGAADHVVSSRDPPASVTAHPVATDLGADPEPTLALAGAAAAGVRPGVGATADLLSAAEDSRAVERRPGVAIPTADVAEGLAHQTLVHADFAGDGDAAGELVRDAGVDAEATADEARERLASLVALEAAGDERSSPRAADALERALRPYATPEGPFATVGGYADVLEATARVTPGTGVAITLDEAALDDDLRAHALDAWRNHGETAHEAVRSATTGRYDGLFVARIDRDATSDGDVPVETVARLILDARSPEPAVLAVTDREAGAAATANADVDVGDAMRAAVSSVGGDAGGDAERAYATYDADPEAFVAAFREVEP